MTNLFARVFQGATIALLFGSSVASAFTVPAYGPSFWNASSVKSYNSDYNYSTNVKTNTFAKPGVSYAGNSNHLISSNMNCGAVSWFAALDGSVGYTSPDTSLEFMGTSDPGTCSSSRTKIALVVDPSTDYHWYRLDNNGKWSHKLGTGSAINTDNSSNIITNPETASRGGYTAFCGYFCTGSTSTSQDAGIANIQ